MEVRGRLRRYSECLMALVNVSMCRLRRVDLRLYFLSSSDNTTNAPPRSIAGSSML